MPRHGKPSMAEVVVPSRQVQDVGAASVLGIIQMRLNAIVIRLTGSDMSRFGKMIKAGIVASACGIGLCALARKLRLPTRIAMLAHSIESVPFPGTKLYSFLAARELRPLYAAVAEQISSVGSFRRILDIDTGPGYLPLEIASRNADVCVSGIDRSRQMIELANANARATRVRKSVEFSTGDPTNLPFPGRYFDLVVSVNALHHWRQPLAVFEEVFHILAPGGEFWIYDYRRNVSDDVWEELGNKLSMVSRTALLFGPIASSKRAYGRDELLELARQTNFEVGEVEEISLPIFGHSMFVFNRLKLVKPESVRE